MIKPIRGSGFICVHTEGFTPSPQTFKSFNRSRCSLRSTAPLRSNGLNGFNVLNGLQSGRAEAIETTRVAVQKRRFVGGGDFLVLEKFIDLMLAKFVVNLVRIVARINPGFVADPFYRVSDIWLFPFAADKNSAGIDVSGNVFAHFFFGSKL